MKLQRAFLERTLCLLILSAMALGFATSSSAQEIDSAKEHYTKFEYQIAIRDGVKLFTAVYAPKEGSQKYPMIMQRAPYSVAPYGPENFDQHKVADQSRTPKQFDYEYNDNLT